jgi:dipeptidyl aminopeptidase/acylaminoacyl peptidase
VAVLAPNIRGSTGYGKTYQRLIHRDWGGGELEDLKACAEWLKARPDVDPQRLGVFGGSFGGFATLSCLTRLPQYWKSGVDLFGPSNLVTFIQSVPPSWRRFMIGWVGDPEKDREALLARSPITHLDQLRADLMIIQGAKDPRVVKAESDQLVERLRSAGRDVQYLVFEHEGHGFMNPENRRKAMGAAAEFLVAGLAPPAA